MSIEWKTTTIGELCDAGGGSVQTGPFGSQLHASDYVEDGFPSVMPANIGDNRIIEDGIARVSIETQQRLSRHCLQEGDIIYGRRGDIGRRALVRREQTGWLCGTGCLRIRFSDAEADPRYVSFYLGQEHVKELILAKAVGSTMPNLNTGILRSVSLLLPPLPTQRRIAEILGALDDKIECNRQINRILEAMAQALYQHWFVDFGPFRDGEFVESELRMIPEGWSVRSLYECASYVNGAAFKQSDFTDDRVNALPIIKIGELKNGITAQTQFTNKELDSKYKLTGGDILFSWSGSPDTSIDTFIWSRGEAWLNQHTFSVIPHRPSEKAFVWCFLKFFKPIFVEIARNKQTTGLGHVTIQDLKRLKIVVPSEKTFEIFDRKVGSLFDQTLLNLLESQKLAQTRDYLLPRLLSGEIEVRAADL